MTPAGLILAAGASRRMGVVKALLEFQGETFLDRLIGIFARHCSPVIVVLGYHEHAIRTGLRRGDQAQFVVNPEPALGQFSSLQCGLRQAPEAASGVLFTPVDYPMVQPATVEALAGRFRQGGVRLVIPRCSGKRGHPVLFSRSLIAEFLALPPDSQAREVLRRHYDDAAFLDVNEPGILKDIDDPEAYRRLMQAGD